MISTQIMFDELSLSYFYEFFSLVIIFITSELEDLENDFNHE